MGRAPCCDKANVKKGPWSPEEDAKLKSYIEQHGTGGNWIALPQKIGLKRCGKSCRLRWLNYLRPNIKHGGFSEEEDNIICSLYISIGSRWSIIAAQLPGRTDNDIKNYWNTRLKKKLLGKQRKAHQPRRGKGSDQNSMVSDTTNQSPYSPEFRVLGAPVPYSNKEPRFNDHASFRKLLIKLGGKFSDDDHPIQCGTNVDQCPVNISSTQQPYVPSIEMVSSGCTDALDGSSSQFANTPFQYNIDEPGMAMVSSFPAEFEKILYNNPQRLYGLEFLYGDMVSSLTERSTSGESFGWGGMSTLSYPPISSSSYGELQQAMLQECTFDDMRFSGAH